MATLTALRESIASMLSQELAIDFVPGRIEGPVEGKDLGCSWTIRVLEGSDGGSGGIIEQTVLIGVRVFKPFKKRDSPARGIDPAPLEELAEQIQLAVSKHQTGYGAWFQRVTEVEFDVESRMVEVAILAVQANPAI